MIRVYGDIMLDRWIYGTANRISPEAPVPVLLETSQKYSIGGAGNLALNIQSINGTVALYGSVGNDNDGAKLLELISDTTLTSKIVLDHSTTTTKTRFVDKSSHHIMRWDNETVYTGVDALHQLLDDLVQGDIVCVSDYNKGTVRNKTVEKILKRKCKVLVDPKQDPSFYKGAYLVKPNMKEYTQWFGKFTYDDARMHMKTYEWDWLVVTDGANGIHVISWDDQKHFQEPVKEVADVTGAGDTVLAVIAQGVEHGMDMYEACKLACFGAARIVEKSGVAVITKKELNRGTVFTNGVFDILHVGHLKLLNYAKSIGNKLIVGINSDSSVKRLKGDLRPINDQDTRKESLLQLGFIDDVIIFDEDTPLEVITKLEPDIIVKGGDYVPDTVVGNHLAEVHIFPTVDGYSTTRIIESMKV